jgi:hypothetical protein
MIRVPAALDDSMLDRFFQTYEAVMARGQRFVTVTDATAVASRPTPVVRRRLAEWTSKVEKDLIVLSVGDARVVESALIRGAMTAIGWVHQHPIEQKWFTKTEDALELAIGRLDSAGVAVPPEARVLLSRPRTAL